MGTSRARVVALSVGSVALLVAGTARWSPHGGSVDRVAQLASLALAAIVAWQIATVLRGDPAQPRVARVAYALGAVSFVAAALTGYVLVPHGAAAAPRPWSPLLAMIGSASGLLAIYLASSDAADARAGGYRAPSVPPLSTAKVRPGPPPGAGVVKPMKLPSPELMPLDTPRTPREIAGGRARVPSANPLDAERGTHAHAAPTAPAVARTATAPFALRGKLKYVAAVAELSATGLDARREDGSTRIVAWPDIVGIVARRLPPAPPYDGVTFVDLVSTAGSTVRVLPWTRLTGDRVEGEGDERARSLVQLVASRCPDAQIDPATRRFLGSKGTAAQLPDEPTLAAHDERLA